ncbi:hypothetical protein PG999_006460 [Apiospora kogelbergensis]|uniref:Uncharacterized protein n=1 Tax=Apiospora kogelbergensis TaxID=1337665 RepID=A0AAW0QVB4_9PEZI
MSSLPGINTNDKPITHPTPAEAYELACNYAALLRALYTNPQFRFQETPTPEIAKVSKETHMGLFFVTDFVENTYVKHVLPYLPAGGLSTLPRPRQPWDPESQTMWDKKGSDAEEEEEVPFPTFPESDAREMVSDIWTRGFMAQKIIVENETDPKARALAGGQPFDFGPEARELVKKVGIPEKGVPK